MSQVQTASIDDIKKYFTQELTAVMNRQQVSAQSESLDYLVDLLMRHLKSENFFHLTKQGNLEDNVVALIYKDYVESEGEVKRHKLRRLGDVCLLMTGLFPESLRKKIVNLEYYWGMGGSAYEKLSELHLSEFTRGVFGELAHKFKDFSHVLSELSERSGLQSNQDLINLYERWLTTGDDRLRDRLVAMGIMMPSAAPIKVPQ